MTFRLTKFAILSYGLFKMTSLSGIALPVWMTSWFADLLCLPVILGIGLLFLRFYKSDANLFLTPGQVLFVFLLFSLLFEYLLPTQNRAYIADPVDVLMYACGAFVFHTAQLSEQKLTVEKVKSGLVSGGSTFHRSKLHSPLRT
jgi:hypothetical protein